MKLTSAPIDIPNLSTSWNLIFFEKNIFCSIRIHSCKVSEFARVSAYECIMGKYVLTTLNL